MMLEWNVYYGDFGGKKIRVGNIFDHGGFMEDCREAYKKCADNREDFLDKVRWSLMYYYWSRCEWEIVLDLWPHRDGFDGYKVDVYDQVVLNWDKFSDYVWANKDEFKKEKKRR